MRNYIVLDVLRSQSYGLNPTESILASFLYGLIAQYEPIPYNGRWYYMADYSYIINNCPLLPDKVDTLRRLYKRLEAAGLISVIKLDNHVCFTPAEDLRNWGDEYIRDAEKNPNSAEKNPNSAEKNPNSAEKNPHSLNIIDNNIDNIRDNNKRPQNAPGLFPETEIDKKKKTLFRNSEIYAKVVGDNYAEFEALFASPEFAKVDLVYYFHAVADWSDQKDMKRTAAGWVATVRNFIRGDMEKNKLHVKNEWCQTAQKVDIDGAIAFLRNEF